MTRIAIASIALIGIPEAVFAQTSDAPCPALKTVLKLSSGDAIEAEVETEAAAQIALLQKRGLHLSHIDTHKHTHMFSRVLRSVLRAARAERGSAALALTSCSALRGFR